MLREVLSISIGDAEELVHCSATWRDVREQDDAFHDQLIEGLAPLQEAITANSRGWNSFWAWRDKPSGERGAARDILLAAGMTVSDLRSGDNPPDCETRVDGEWSGIEVTELADEKTLKRSLKALKQRAMGREPDRAEAYFIWREADLISQIQSRIVRKDKANLRGRSYKRYILVIHTDECFLDAATVDRFLEGAIFRAEMITDVVLGLSYEPGLKRCPTFRLVLDRDTTGHTTKPST